MKISTRLGLTGLFAFVGFVIVGAVLLFSAQQVKEEVANNATASEILNAVIFLQYLALEGAPDHGTRSEAQWRLRNGSLSDLLSTATGSTDHQARAALDDIHRGQRNIEALFEERVVARDEAQAGRGDAAVLRDRDTRLTAQILNAAQDMVSNALSLSESSRRGVLGAQQRVNLAALLFGVAVLLALAVTRRLVVHNILRPLTILREGTVIVGTGNLDYRLANTTRDEIGDLSCAFNEMAEALKGTTVSRDELEKANDVLKTEMAERKRAEERFRLVVLAAPNAMIMVDRSGQIVMVNSRAENLFGYDHDELLGQSMETLVPERFRSGHTAYRAAFFGAPASRSMGTGRDLFGLRRDGVEVPIEVGLTPIETSEGVFVLGAIADITEHERSAEELRGRTEELARSNQDLEQFAYVASHDLQEPLRAVAGSLQLLQRRYQAKLDAKGDELIGHAVDGAARMQTLIDGLLTYSRVGKQDGLRRLIACEIALDRALQNLATALDEADAQVSRDTLPAVVGIPEQLSLLFQNLVGNAIKFRDKTRPLRIHVGAEHQGETWLLWVKDNGIGIDPQYFERIFLIFQRLHTRRDYPGTGIGLALCKRIVEYHEGTLWLESEPGAGATFFFTLPNRDGDENATTIALKEVVDDLR